MKSVKKLFFTTIALTLTSFLMKTVAVWFNVYLTGLVGTVGMGIFQLIMSVYAMAKTLGYGGMNLAATRLCIDDFECRRFYMRRVLFTAFIIGSAAFSILFLLAKPISKFWIMTEKAALSLKILSFSLPFVSLSSALNGYMTAARKMSRYSFIQLSEQVAKIGLTIWIINSNHIIDIEIGIAMVCFAISISEVFSFSLALFCYLSDIKKSQCQYIKKPGFFRKMARLAVPDALGSYIRSALNTVEHLLIPRGIKKSGTTTAKALSDYGIVQGMALPILLYPSSVLGVVSGLLVPEIAECKIKGNKIQVNYIINRVLQVSMIFSIITMSVMITFANELSVAVYGDTNSADFIKMIAPLIPIMYLDMTTDGMLKGLDLQFDIMKINVIDSVLCVVLVAILVPKVAVEGYIITIYAAEIINFLLSFQKLSKSARLRFGVLKNVIKPFFCASASVILSRRILTVIKVPTVALILAIGAGIVIYYFLLRLFGGITKEDAKWFRRLILP